MVLQHLRLFGMSLGLAAVLGACAAPVCAADKTKIEDESPSATMPEDPKTKAYVRRAETAIRDKEWNQALTLLEKIVTECGDSVVIYRRNTLEQLNIDADTVQFHWWTFISTRELVARMKAELPDQAKELGQVSAGPEAKSMLKTGIETGDAELLVAITENYAGTDSAPQALYVLGEWNLLKEDYASAVSCFRRILAKYEKSNLDAPSIRWRLCQALELAGDVKGAVTELSSLMQAGKYPTVARGAGLEAVAQAWLAKLKTQTTGGSAQTVAGGSAVMMMGDATHANYIKDVPPMGDRMLTMEYDLAFVEQVHKTEISERDAAANLYPVVRDETVFLTDGSRIRAYNLINPDPKRPYWAQPSTEDRRALDPNRIEHCRTLTVSDTMVFAVMGQTSDVSVAFDWNQGPRYQFAKTHLEGYERPVGHPVMYGRIKWSTYKTDDMVNSASDKQFLDSVHIPAAPVYVDGVLYCSAISLDDEHAVYALAFNADTGKLRWHHKLCSGTLLAGVNRVIDLGSEVAVSAGKVYVLTPMGTLACLEAISGSVKWQTCWQQTVEMQKMNNFNGQAHFPDDVPYPTPPIVFKDRVMIMPQDCNWLIAFDADTGEPKWIRDRREDGANLHYLYGIATTETTVRRKGVKYTEQVGILIGAGKKLIAFNVSNGKAVWERDLTGYDRAVGIGVVTENWVLVPTRTHLVPARVTDGTIPRDDEKDALWHPFKWESPKLQGGHVLVSNGVIITAGPNAFSVYYIKAERQKQLLAKMQADGESPDLWMQIADLDDRTHEFDKALESLAKAHTLAATWAALPPADAKQEAGKNALEESGRRIAAINFKAGMQSLLPIQNDDDKIAGGAKEGLLAADERGKLATAALARFDVSLSAVRALATPPVDLGAQAVWGRARALETMAAADKKAAAAIGAYQELLSKYPEVTYAFYNDGKTETTAKSFGREKIQQLIEKYGRDQYAAVEAEAVRIYNEEAAKKPAARNLERLRTMLEAYPNANARGDALLLSAEVAEAEKGPREALTYLHQFLAVNGDNPKAPQAQYSLYTLYHKLQLFGAAKSQAIQLKRRYPGQKIMVDGKPVETTALAEELLKLPELLPPPSIAMRKVLTNTAVEAWPLTLPRPGALFPLVAEGEPPAGCEKYIYVHDGRDIYCIEGTTGARKFAHHALNLAQRPLQAAFAANDLVTISGDNSVSGENAAGDDKPWTYDFTVKGEKRNATILLGSDTLALVIEQKSMIMAGIEPTSGHEMWTRTDIHGSMGMMPPRIIENRVVITTVDDGECTVHVLDSQTGMDLCTAYKLEAKGIRLTSVGSSTLVVQDAKNNLIGFELFSGKQIWKTPTASPVMTLANRWPPVYSPTLVCTDKQVIALHDGTIDVLNLSDGKPVGGADAKPIDLSGQATALEVEGDQFFVTYQERANMARPFLGAFSLTTGALQWRTPYSMQPQLSSQQITRSHVVLMANDFNNNNTFMLNMVDRVTGKIVFSNKLHNLFPTCLATANGAILMADQQRVRGYVCIDPAQVKIQVAASEKAWNADQKNMALMLAYVDNLALDGQSEKGFDIVSNAIQQGMVTEENWQSFASKLEALRRGVLEKHKYKFLIQKAAKPPTVDGDLKDWNDAVWFEFKDLRYLYHDTFDKDLAKGFWKTPEDLSCRTAMKWDKDNLYICWEVTDDVHEQTKTGLSIWDGDSIQFAIDPNMDGGTTWRPGDTEDTIAVNSADGSSSSAIDYSPTNKNPDFKGSRDKAKHKTYYEMSIPLADVQLDAKDGGKFGYTFIVNDRDDEKSNLNKGLAPSPGIWNPKTPGMYAVAYFGKEGQTELDAKQKEDLPVANDKGDE